jgi:hypothetical protein
MQRVSQESHGGDCERGGRVSEGSNRRTFLRDALQRAAQGSRGVLPGSELLFPEVGGSKEDAPVAPPPPTPRRRIGHPGAVEMLPAQGAERRADVEELLELAAEHGPAGRADELRKLARVSVRLSPDPEAEVGDSHGAGAPDLPAGVSWPHADGAPLTFVGRVGSGATLETPPLPPLPAASAGVLLFVSAATTAPAQHAPVPACVLAIGAGATERVEGPVLGPGRPLRVTTELSLPPAWSTGVQESGLDREEREAWERLRLSLAAAQGVDLQGAISRRRRAHHLFGFPDEPGGSMSAACDGAEVAAGRATPREWRLVAQLDTDPEAGWGWGGGVRRLFVWQRDDAGPALGEPAPAWAIVR